MTLTKEDVDRIGKEISEFEKILPGVRFGEDFPQFAITLLGTETFDQMVQMSTIMGLLCAITLKPPPNQAEPPSKDFIDQMLKDSPMREFTLRAIYFGYRLGKL